MLNLHRCILLCVTGWRCRRMVEQSAWRSKQQPNGVRGGTSERPETRSGRASSRVTRLGVVAAEGDPNNHNCFARMSNNTKT